MEPFDRVGSARALPLAARQPGAEPITGVLEAVGCRLHLMSRDEVFKATGPTSGASMWVKIGAKKDGTITAADGVFKFQAGRLSRLAGHERVPVRVRPVDPLRLRLKTQCGREPR
jgi:hypothetical protein